MPTHDARNIADNPPEAPQPPTGAGAAQLFAPEDVKAYGRYLLFRKIAEGGMAEIFLAKKLGEKGFERDVVIKRMLGHLSQQPEFFDMFLDEARIAAKLQHPNIVQIDDFGQIDGRYFICMEYLAGEDFSNVVRTASRRREYVPINVAVRVIIDAARGLAHAHDFADDTGKPLNIVHRDISPSNIYVTYAGQVKVLDFGIAKAESRSTSTTAGVVKGKYMYMAPEQARGLPVDRRADVFSLGVSLYEALTNTRPFAKDNDLAILNAVLRGDFPHPRTLRPELPAELEAIVIRAMHADKAQRYPSAAELAADLERYLGSSTSASGGMQVASYVKSLFPEERITLRSRVPSLATIAATGVALPVLGTGSSPAVAVVARPQDKATRVMPAFSSDPSLGTRVVLTGSGSAQRPPSRGAGVMLGVAGTLAAVAVAAGGGYLWWSRQPKQQTEVALVTPPVEPPKKVELPVEPPSKDEPAKLSAGGAAENDLGAVKQEPMVEPDRKKATRSAPTGPLTAGEIAKVVRTRQSQMLGCFHANREELGAEKGVTNVQFSVAGSGAVSGVEVQGALANATAGQCLKKQFQALKFRKHPDQEVRLVLPFQWTLQR